MKTVIASLSVGVIALVTGFSTAHAAEGWKPGVVVYAVEAKEKIKLPGENIKIEEAVVVEEDRAPRQHGSVVQPGGSVVQPSEGWAHRGGSVIAPNHGGSVVAPKPCKGNGSVVRR